MRLRAWPLLALALASCDGTKDAAAPGGDATTLDGLDSTAFAKVSDLAPLATRAELSAYATVADLASYATTAQLSGLLTASDLAPYATQASLGEYAKKTDLGSYVTTDQLSSYATTSQLSSYATVAQVDAAVATCVPQTDPRLSDARPPIAGSPHYVQNGEASYQPAAFKISGNGTIGGDLTVLGATRLSGGLVVEGGAIAGPVPIAAAPPPCDPTRAGYLYLDSARLAFFGCDGSTWVCLGGACP